MEDFGEGEEKMFLMEKSAQQQKSVLDVSIKQNAHSMSSFREELSAINDEIKTLNIEIGELKILMLYVVKALRQSSSKLELDRLSKKVEHWDPQNIITRDAFMKILEEAENVKED